MKTLIVDDEQSARRRLIRLLRDFSDVEIAGEAEDGIAALEEIDSLRPDLLFLDIQMPELDGFGVIRSLPPDIAMPLTIFATSYDQHAMQAFEANALAYLLKPVEQEKLALCMDRARRILSSYEGRKEDQKKTARVAHGQTSLNRVVGRKHGNFVLLHPSEILWFYSEEGIVRARTANDSYWVNYQLNELENSLDKTIFFRARREALVNLEAVRSIKPYDRSTFVLTMSDEKGTDLLVSERQAKELRQRLPGL